MAQDERITLWTTLHDGMSRGLRRIRTEAARTGVGLRRLRDENEDLGDSSDKTERKVKSLTERLAGFGNRLRNLRPLVSVLSFVGIVAAIPVAIQAVFALTAGVAALAGSLAQLGGVVAAVPAGLFALAAGFAAVKVGTQGIGDAVKALAEDDRTQANIDKTREAMKDLGPEARLFARHLASLEKPWVAVRKEAQAGLVPGLDQALKVLAPLLRPLGGWLRGIGREMGGLAVAGAEMVSGWNSSGDLGRLFSQSERIIGSVGRGVLGFADALRHVAVAAGPFAEWMARGFESFGRWAAGAAEAGRESGGLAEFLDKTKDSLQPCWHVVRDLGVAIWNFAQIGADAFGTDWSHGLEEWAAGIRAATESEGGVARIADWFERMERPLRELGGLVGDLAGMLSRLGEDRSLTDTISMLREFVPYLEDFLNGDLGTLLPFLLGLARDIVSFLSVIDPTPMMILGEIIGGFLAGVAWIITNVPLAGQIIGTLIGTFLMFSMVDRILSLFNLTLLINGVETTVVSAAWKGLGIMAGWLKTQVLALNAAFWANPIAIVIALVVGLVALFIYAYNRSEKLREGIAELWEGMKTAALTVAPLVIRLVNAMIQGYTTLAAAALNAWAAVQEATPGGSDGKATRAKADAVMAIGDKAEASANTALKWVEDARVAHDRKRTLDAAADKAHGPREWWGGGGKEGGAKHIDFSRLLGMDSKPSAAMPTTPSMVGTALPPGMDLPPLPAVTPGSLGTTAPRMPAMAAAGAVAGAPAVLVAEGGALVRVDHVGATVEEVEEAALSAVSRAQEEQTERGGGGGGRVFR